MSTPKPINPLTWNPMKRSHNHGFRFSLWRESPSIRFFVESVYIVALTLAMQVLLSQIQILVLNLRNNQITSLMSATDTTTIQTLHREIAQSIKDIITWFTYLQYAFFCFASFIFLPLFDFCAQYPLKKPFKWNKITYILDISSLAMFSFFFSQVYQLLIKNREDDGSPDFNQAITELFNRVYIQNIEEFDILLGLGIMGMWLRVVFVFRASQFIGPFIKVIGKMTTDILIFFVLYIVIIISFASVGNLAFGEFTEYSDLFQACITLFGSSLGGFDFTIIDTYFGKIYLALFLIISLIMLLNLLIAILSTTYSYYESRGRGLYLQEILGLWEDVQYGGNRGFLVIKTVPFHAVTIPLIPFYICCNSKLQKKCDYLTQGVLFIPSIILHIALQLIITAICLPFAYLKLIFHSAAAIFRFRGRQRCRLIIRFFMVIILGLVILGVRMIFDIFFLVIDDFRLNPPREQIEFKGATIHVEVLSILTNILESKINHKHIFESVATRDVLIELRSQLGIQLTYSDICQMTYIFMNKRPPIEMLNFSKEDNSPKLEQFTVAKEYLLQNSMLVGNQNYRIYPYIMMKVLEEHLQSYKHSKKSLSRTESVRRVNHGKRRIRPVNEKELKKANHWGRDTSSNNVAGMHSLEQIKKMSQSNILGRRSIVGNVNRSISGIEESDETENIGIPLHIKLPPLAVGHFAKVEEDSTESGEVEDQPDDSLEERIARIEKVLRRSSYQE